MRMRGDNSLDVLIAARNEMFLSRTIEDVISHIEADTEVIAVIDGGTDDPPIKQHPRVNIIRLEKSIGQRAAVNLAARESNAKYIMKLDAHCSVDQGFDRKLIANCEYDWTVIPEMRNLHAFNWLCEKCGNETYQGPTPIKCDKCDNTKDFVRKMIWLPRKGTHNCFMRFDSNLHFQYWSDYKTRPEAKGDVVECMSLIGAGFFLHRERYWDIDGLDEGHGSWGQMGTEIAMKSFLSGGKLMANKKTWFAHMFRTQGGDFSFPYHLSGRDVDKARKYSNDMWKNNKWEKAVYPVSRLLENFWPIPGWEEADLKLIKENEMKTSSSGVYSIKNNVNGKIYIGSAVDISSRFRDHIKELRKNVHSNGHLQNSWNKHGEHNFSFDVECLCVKEELVSFEQDIIDSYTEVLGWENLYNIAPTAGSMLGFKHSEETRAKMRENNAKENNPFYGKTHSAESIEKQIESHKGQLAWNKGVPWSEEVKQKIGAGNAGKTPSEEARRKISEKLKGRIFTEEHKAKLVNSSRFSGHHHSEESRKMIGDSQRGVPKSEEHNRKNSEAHKGKIFTEEHRRNLSLSHQNKSPSMGIEMKELTKGIVYYTDNQLDPKIDGIVKGQLNKISQKRGIKIVSVSLKPIDFGQNVVLPLERGTLTMTKQILAGLEAIDTDIVFFCEHDVIYHPCHFDFSPLLDDVYWYNENVWKVRSSDGQAVFFHTKQTSGCCATRKMLLEHYRKRVARIENEGFHRTMGFEPGCHHLPNGVDNFTAREWWSVFPNVDIRHATNLTWSRFKPEQYRSQRSIRGWNLADEVPYWGRTKGRFEEFLNDVKEGRKG